MKERKNNIFNNMNRANRIYIEYKGNNNGLICILSRLLCKFVKLFIDNVVQLSSYFFIALYLPGFRVKTFM